jgi:hypothetical protein
MMDERITESLREYRDVFCETADQVHELAESMRKGLIPEDIAGVFFAVGIQVLDTCMTSQESCAWLRTLADRIEARSDRSVN